MLTARFMNREPPGRRSYGPILVPVFITLAWLLTFTEVRQSQWVRPFLRSLPANLDRPAAHPFHFNHGVPRPHSGTAPSLPSALAAQSASGMYGGTDPLSSDSALPLAGRRILITAPRAYATALAARLVAAGARPLWVPGVVTRRLSSGSPLAPALDSFHRPVLLSVPKDTTGWCPRAYETHRWWYFQSRRIYIPGRGRSRSRAARQSEK